MPFYLLHVKFQRKEPVHCFTKYHTADTSLVLSELDDL